MSRSGLLWTIIALVVIAGVAFWLMQPTPETNVNVTGGTATGQEPATSTSTGSLTGTVAGGTTTGTATVTGSATGGANAPMTASVTYNGTSFSPRDVTIKKGGTVTWTNSGSGQMWVASASHPTHAVYAGTTRTEHCPGGASTAFDQCASGQSYSFTFDKVGKWNYHDHVNASAFGSVTVVE